MQSMSQIYYSDKAQRGQALQMDLVYSITAAKTVAAKNANVSLVTFDALASQAVINDFLGTTNEFLLAAFDATSMGADMFGGIVDMGGQVSELISMEAICYSGSDGLTSVQSGVVASSALTASTLKTEAAKGADGNLGFKVNFGNTPDFDALTSGLIIVKLKYKVK